MSTADAITMQSKTTAANPSPTAPTVDGLIDRLAVEVSGARQRIQSLQTEAGAAFLGQEQRILSFAAVAKRIDAILLPRLEALTNLEVFKNIQQSVTQERQVLEVRGRQARTTTLSVPFSDECPARVQLSFRVDHDLSVENILLDYRLEILPIFFKFNSHEQLITPLEPLNENVIGAWIEDRLVEFTRTFFELYFHDEYQKQHLETDPVMNIRFPRTFAVGKQEYEGQTYHFYSNESLQRFAEEPEAYSTKLLKTKSAGVGE